MNSFLSLELGNSAGLRTPLKAEGRCPLQEPALVLSEFCKIRFGGRITPRIVQTRWFIRAPPEVPSLVPYNP
jgi:hypothetical protein